MRLESMVGLAAVVVNGEIGSAMWAEIPKEMIERRVRRSGGPCNKKAFVLVLVHSDGLDTGS
jgi:hypothetical protein